MNVLRRLTTVAVVIAAAATLGPAAASADRIDPITPSGPLPFATTLQNTPEGASSRIAFRYGDVTIVPTGVFGGRKIRVAGAGEAYLLHDGRGPEGKITGQDIETGYVLSCAVKNGGVKLETTISGGAIAQIVQLSQSISLTLLPGEFVKVKLGEKSKNGDIKVGQRVGVRYDQTEITVAGCIGNTYAYPYVKYTTSTDAFDNTKTLLGQTVYLAF